MKSKWSIWGPLLFVAFLSLFFVLLRNLSSDLNTLLDITRTSQNEFEPKDKENAYKRDTIHVQDVGRPLFRGRITRTDGFEKAQGEVSGSEADLPIYPVPSEEIASDETPTSVDQNPERSSEKTSPPKNDHSKHFYFSVHYASHRNQTDAEMEVARLSNKGLHAWWAKKDLAGKGEWFRVYIGKEKTRQDAMKLALKLKEDGIIKEDIRVYKVKAE
jgi:hypothetical protein